MSQLNLPGRATMSVPVDRSISWPWASESVCRKDVRSVLRLSRYLSSGVAPVAAGAAAGVTAGAAAVVAAVADTAKGSSTAASKRAFNALLLGGRRHEHLAR